MLFHTRSPLPQSGVTAAVARYSTAVCLALSLVCTTGCSSDKLVGTGELPDQVIDPAQTQTPQGALSTYYGALTMLRDAMASQEGGYVRFSGQLSDEMRANVGAPLYYNLQAGPDARQYLDTYERTQFRSYPYAGLQGLRGQANQAEGLLRDFPPANSLPLIAHMLVVKGYAEVLLAELYCSGIPLSTLDYKGDFTYKSGLPTDSVLVHAIALFDSAMAIVGPDSVSILNLARVGKGRALLQMGEFQKASQAVVEVPPAFRYNLQYSVAAKVYGIYSAPSGAGNPFRGFVGDREGINGLPFVSERDARLPQFREDTVWYISTYYYERTGPAPVPVDPSVLVLASGVEAQLIRAEAALRANDPSWLTLLNQLRTSCTDAASCPTPAPKGLGDVDSLPLLDADNLSAKAKVDLLFRERAYWLFLTGHRTGDLRRLIRFYQRDSETVFPTGAYDGAVPTYGGDVNMPVPRAERERNPLYRGCISRGA